MASRAEVRAALVALVSGVVSCPVTAARFIDDPGAEYVNIFIADGQTEYDGLRQRKFAELTVSYRNQALLEDDAIDIAVQPIEAAITPQSLSDAGVSGVVSSGFEYLDDAGREYSGIDLKYTIYY